MEQAIIIARIAGGLGNQLFQYAMARRLANRHETVLKLDLSGYADHGDQRPTGLNGFQRKVALSSFNILATVATAQEIARVRDSYTRRLPTDLLVRLVRRAWPSFCWPASHIRERGYRFDAAALQLPQAVYLQGFWQSEKYFDDIRAIIQSEFTLKDHAIHDYARAYVNRLRVGGAKVVSLHVRRGDLAHAHEVLKKPGIVHGAPVPLEYIYNAIKEFDSSCRFLVFSDSTKDIQWCRQSIQAPRLAFAEGHSDIQDFALMSACDHHIIANSTFSWWAAWLNPNPAKRVIAPCTWSVPGSAGTMVTDDLIPAGWQML